MKRPFLIILALLVWLGASVAFAQTKTKTPKKSKSDSLITISTQFGEIKLLLYEGTPKHRANFLKLVREKFYDDLLFHRVIKDFMIQGGDPNSRKAAPGQMLGSGSVAYKIDAEFNPNYIHKRGAIAAARDNNPQKASSGCQFYIVQGRKFTDKEIFEMGANQKISYTPDQNETYKNIGGTPFLDQNYTVFGEVIQGMDVVDKITQQATDNNDRPRKDIQMNIKVEKMSKKKITKLYGYIYNE
ncbi:MAG: peptidylprolyl isomerase [Microscillaceae bacterium]|jgi:peptidyl-prolyl cis-trans isomerase B (cyclophilin B)|nr:peptidylprolyl isomerase [Microscillaceae bacterium]